MTPRSLARVVLLAMALCPAAARGQAALTDSVRAGIDRVFARWDHTDTPGCALGISQQGVVSYERGYGMADLQHGLAITPGSIFHVASVSKEFSAFAVGLLADDGRLSLDDDIRKYVPEIPDHGARITIRHLMHHVSGLRDQWNLLGYAGWRDDDLITEQDVLDIVGRQRGVNFAPGAEYMYSNTGYTLLGVIVKRVSGSSLRDFAQARIFEPLGMRDTHFHDDHTMIVPRRTSAYQPRTGGGWFISIPVFDTYGATSLFTTPRDLLTWMAQLDRPRVGSPKLIEEMHRSAVLTDGTPTGYGFGLATSRYRGLTVVGHSGADAGYRSIAERYPDRALAITVLCNASNSAPGTLARRVADVLIGASAPVEMSAVDTVSRASPGASLARWAGTYRDTVSGLALRIRLRGDTLSLGDGRRLTLTSDSTAFAPGGGTGFVLRSSGAAVRGVTRLPATTRTVFFRREPPFAPDRAALAAFEGEYFSEELDVRYRLVLGDSGLAVHARRIDEFRLTPAWPDAFTSEFGAVLQFVRGAGNRVERFTVTDDRVRGVKFVRAAR